MNRIERDIIIKAVDNGFVIIDQRIAPHRLVSGEYSEYPKYVAINEEELGKLITKLAEEGK